MVQILNERAETEVNRMNTEEDSPWFEASHRCYMCAEVAADLGDISTIHFCQCLGINGQEFEDLGMTLDFVRCKHKIKTVREKVMNWVVERKTGVAVNEEKTATAEGVVTTCLDEEHS